MGEMKSAFFIFCLFSIAVLFNRNIVTHVTLNFYYSSHFKIFLVIIIGGGNEDWT